MQTPRKFRCAFNVISALVVALLGAPVVAMGQVLPTRVAPTAARDSSHTLSQSSYPLLPPYTSRPSYPSSSPFAAGMADRPARFTPPTALVGDTSRSSNHRARNTIIGATIGLVAGAYIGGRVGAKAHPCGSHECAGPPLTQLGDGILGALAGLTLGIVVGAAVSGES